MTEETAETAASTPVRIPLPKRCQSHYAGLQCAFVLAHDHPHGNEDSGVYVTWGRMASEQQPTVGRETTITAWQRRAAEWTDSRFPDDTLEKRGLVLGEETGEVLRCILKGVQDIRGGRDHWIGGELPKEAVDVFFCLVALAHRAGFNLADAIEGQWARIAAKVYTESVAEVVPDA